MNSCIPRITGTLFAICVLALEYLPALELAPGTGDRATVAGDLRGFLQGEAVRAAGKAAAHGVDWGQVLATAGIWAGIVGGVAAVVAIVPMSRNGVLWAWRALLMRTGMPYHRYARKFIERYGSYDNPYLQVKETYDLRTTYVPLSFQSEDVQSTSVATDVLTNLPARRLVIVGDPGSGKSTLLKAYGVGTLERRFILARRPRVVPYLIPMRDLAASVGEDRGIADFITDEILNGFGVFKRDRAAEFFVRTLQREQAVVMLDGLDEVPDGRQQVVLACVIAFMGNLRQECPTGRAKILLTCRTQNFEVLREDWMAALGPQEGVYSLAPLRDSEISSYLLKFKGLFKSVDGPARFMRSVREAKTLELLRAPLVLAIAVGLYADRPTMIPSTISELYHRMIEELLDRHAFRHERRPDESLLMYRRTDKYRFLREFALHAARQSSNFSDFTRASLAAFGVDLAPRLEDAGDGKAMVTEIIDHSGLLCEAGHGELWHYAHRSIQEFLAAEELRLHGDGDRTLLDRANDLNWRQAIQFYTAGEEARKVDNFLGGLAKRNSELAAHCLQAAKPSDDTARAVLDALEPITDTSLSALAAATRSPRVPIRTMAAKRLRNAIIHSQGLFASSNASTDDLLPLLDTIAKANAAEIAALVPQVVRNLPDDPRLVAPLWECLRADGIQMREQECGEIVRRLLTMVMEPNAFAELERQEPYEWDFLAPLRSRAYPFSDALPRDHNLVTLLAWAEFLSVSPPDPNRFFQTKAAGRLSQVQNDKRRTVPFPLWVLTRILTGIEAIGSVAITVYLLVEHPGLLLHPYHWWMLAIFCAIDWTPFLLIVTLDTSATDKSGNSFRNYLAAPEHNYESGNFSYFFTSETPAGTGTIFEWPGMFLWIANLFTLAIAPVPLVGISFWLYVSVAATISFSYWVCDLAIFSSARRYYLYRPSEYVDVYDDPRSRHWLVPGSGPGL